MTFDYCPDCPKNDTLIVAAKLDLAPNEIRSGDYQDCKDLCNMMYGVDCQYFNYFTAEYEYEPFRETCILFIDRLEEKQFMKNVISGSGYDHYIYFQPSPTTTTEAPCYDYGYFENHDTDNYYVDIYDKVAIDCPDE